MIDPVSIFPRIEIPEKTSEIPEEGGGGGVFLALLQALSRLDGNVNGNVNGNMNGNGNGNGNGADARPSIPAKATAAAVGVGLPVCLSSASSEESTSPGDSAAILSHAKRSADDLSVAEALVAMLSAVASHLQPWQITASASLATESPAVEQGQGPEPSAMAASELPDVVPSEQTAPGEDGGGLSNATDPGSTEVPGLAPPEIAPPALAGRNRSGRGDAPNAPQALGDDDGGTDRSSHIKDVLASGHPIQRDEEGRPIFNAIRGLPIAHGARSEEALIPPNRVGIENRADPAQNGQQPFDAFDRTGRGSPWQDDSAAVSQRRADSGIAPSDAPSVADTTPRQSAWPPAPIAAGHIGAIDAANESAPSARSGAGSHVGIAPESAVVEQIARWSRFILQRGTREISVQLEPEDLGKVRVHVADGADGLNIKLSAEQMVTRDFIEGRLTELKANLELQGHRVEGFDVAYEPGLAGSGSSQNGDARQPSGHTHTPVARQWKHESDHEGADGLGAPRSVDSIVDYRV